MTKVGRSLLLVLALVSFTVANARADCIDEGSPDCQPAGEEVLPIDDSEEPQGYGVDCWTRCVNKFKNPYWSWWHLRYMYLRMCYTSGQTTYCAYS